MRTATASSTSPCAPWTARLLLLAVLVESSHARHPYRQPPWGYYHYSTTSTSSLFSTSFPLVHAQDGLSFNTAARAAASASISQQPPSPKVDVVCSGGVCRPIVSDKTTDSTNANTTQQNNMRGGSTLTSQQQEEEDAESSSSTTTTTTTTSPSMVVTEPQQPASSLAGEQVPVITPSSSTAVASSTSSSSTTAVSTDDTTSPSPPHPPHHYGHFETKKEKKARLKRHKQIAKKLKNRNARNMRRKVLHACFGLTFAGLNHALPKATFVPCMLALSTATLVMELLRYRKGFGWMNAALHGVLGQSLRKHEMEGKYTGSLYFFTGVTITSWLFDPTAATLGICQLALADPSASYFGRQTRHIYWSRIENGLGGFGRNKGVLGFLGGALFCFPFNYRVLRVAQKHAMSAAVTTPTPSTAVIVVASLLLGLAGALADLAVPTPAVVLPKKILGVRVPPFHVDDNMVVPIFSAYACQEIFRFLQLNHLELTQWLLF